MASPAILVPATGGKLAGKAVSARFLAAGEPGWTDDGPLRPRFARWATSADNRLFARNAVNRLWAHFFGRGLVHPLDESHEGNPPSHPEVLDLLANELAAADFDLKHLIRVICHTRAYQRTSRPVPGNEADAKLLSHMTVKPMRPEMLHDALSIVLAPPMPKPGAKPGGVQQLQPLAGVSREEFVRFFGVRPGEAESAAVNQGILQVLRMMNGPLLNGDVPILARLAKSRVAPDEAIETLYLAAYSRRPTSAELQAMTDFVALHAPPEDAYPGILWALLNSSEFSLNH